MATKIHGMLNLSRIPKNLITTNKNGEKVVWIDVLANKNGADQYGNTHTITIYDKNERKNHYIANLKEQEFGGGAAPRQDIGDLPEGDDSLPF